MTDDNKNSNTSTLPGRILWLVEHCKESSKFDIRYDKDFIKKCGLPNLSYISDLRSGNNTNPGFSVVWNIIKTLDVNPGWLAEGEGKPFPDTILAIKSKKATLQELIKILESHQQQINTLSEQTEQLYNIITTIKDSA